MIRKDNFTPTQRDVINALENQNYNWRSINGIVRETHLPKGEICDMITQLIKDGLVIRAPYRNKKGHRLYTIRKHYCQTIGPVRRLISTITNRIL
jgi:DNA-binding MarR family transcriptional regulator